MYLNMNRSKKGAVKTPESQELDAISQALVQAYRSFNSTTDPVVTDACIFEINALRARRNSVLRRMREQDGQKLER